MRPHISLIVRNVSDSAEFYRRVFDVAPQKQTDAYVKFDLVEPPLNFSMHTAKDRPASQVSHLGIEVDSADDVHRWQTHLEQKGIITRSEKNSDCCYARQDKVWFADPDGNSWEVFFVYEQLPIQEKPVSASACCR